jgi:hypothetical protein
MRRIKISEDRYGQFQITVQQKYWLIGWWGVQFYRRSNYFAAWRLVYTLTYLWNCPIKNDLC